MSQHMELNDWWESCDQLHVFQRWSEKYDKTLLADAFTDWSFLMSKQLEDVLPRPNSYWDLDEARKGSFIDWMVNTDAYNFCSWREGAYADAMEPGWGIGEAE